MTEPDASTLLRNASLVLGLINVLQPVPYAALLDEFGQDRRDDLSESLRFLTSRKLVRALPDRSYRATWLGQGSLWSAVLSRKRDIHRMWYLSDLSDRRRRGEKGRGGVS